MTQLKKNEKKFLIENSTEGTPQQIISNWPINIRKFLSLISYHGNKTSVTYYYVYTNEKGRRGDNSQYHQDVEQTEFSYSTSENVNSYNAFGKLYWLLVVVIGISYNPTIPFFGIKSTKACPYVY